MDGASEVEDADGEAPDSLIIGERGTDFAEDDETDVAAEDDEAGSDDDLAAAEETFDETTELPQADIIAFTAPAPAPIFDFEDVDAEEDEEEQAEAEDDVAATDEDVETDEDELAEDVEDEVAEPELTETEDEVAEAEDEGELAEDEDEDTDVEDEGELAEAEDEGELAEAEDESTDAEGDLAEVNEELAAAAQLVDAEDELAVAESKMNPRSKSRMMSWRRKNLQRQVPQPPRHPLLAGSTGAKSHLLPRQERAQLRHPRRADAWAKLLPRQNKPRNSPRRRQRCRLSYCRMRR